MRLLEVALLFVEGIGSSGPSLRLKMDRASFKVPQGFDGLDIIGHQKFKQSTYPGYYSDRLLEIVAKGLVANPGLEVVLVVKKRQKGQQKQVLLWSKELQRLASAASDLLFKRLTTPTA
ncbi:uncharacterized protein LOC127258699 [Andrographis paniculata]|uniref:uncharacterized protein LOC127258699 n=1 Tax=Andrographis paniculata TaxID=175694 RepID=UPI0021E8934E|nr:uncharacterized protein LOC127258699 [Andrographis paniculata]